MNKGALDGIKIIDLTRVLAGPWATQTLGDYGADVVKVERPSVGDETRHWGPPWHGDGTKRQSAYFLSANRNKRSIALDFTDPLDLQTLLELIAQADVLVENYKVGGLAQYGLDYESLHERFPKLIYASISGFGQDGPYRDQLGYDFIIQAIGGLMSITGLPDEQGGEPTKVGVALADILTGLYATNAILAALIHRNRNGEGQHIDLALLDVQVATLANQAMNYLVSGIPPQRLGNAHPNIVPYQTFATGDGYIVVAVGNDGQFAALAQVLGVETLVDNEHYQTNSARVKNRTQLIPLLQAEFTRQTSAQWLQQLNAARVPCGPINSLNQVFEHPQIKHRGLQLDQNGVPGVANPVVFSKTPTVTSIAPPLLDGDREAILSDWLNH